MLVAHRPETGSVPGAEVAFDNESGLSRAEAIRVRDIEAPFELAEDQRQRVEDAMCAVPDVLVGKYRRPRQNDLEVSEGMRGELLTRGPYTLRGYFRAPGHNARSFRREGSTRLSCGLLLLRHRAII